MTDLLRTIRLGLYFLALPLVATISASAHSWVDGGEPVTALPMVFALTSPNSPGPPSASLLARSLTQSSHVVQLDENGFVNGRVVAQQADRELSADKVSTLPGFQSLIMFRA